jgi:DNA-binding CsgD family transcriptional regulator/PAS domain-containing protein
MSTADLFYEAALHPEGWQAALTAIAADFEARDVAIGALNSSTSVSEMINLPIDPFFEKQYASYWSARNFLWDQTAKLPAGQTFSFDSVMPRRDFIRTPFYNEWWHPQGLDHALGINLISDPQLSVVLTLYRPRARPNFSRYDRRKLELLSHHLIRAMEIKRCLTNARSIEADFRDTLVAIGKPGIVVDAGGQLLFCNRGAQELLASKALSLSGSGKLITSSPVGTLALHRLVDSASSKCSPGCMFIVREGQKSMLARVCPLPGNNSAFTTRRVLILFDDPDAASTVAKSSALLRAEYGLTPKESELAVQLASGDSVLQFADRTGTSYATVRTHLARTFHKLGVHSQPALCRLMIKYGFDTGDAN